jgi:DNA invertase Pin-like site-specific DNA recombinase
MIKKIGYTRVSQKNQDYNNQIIQLKDYDNSINDFVNEKISSGVKLENRKLYELLQKSEKGTQIYITNLDRLARNVSEIETIIDICKTKDIKIYITKINIILEKDMNHISKMFIQMMGAFAEMEKEHIKDRIRDGIEKALKNGKKLGRKKGSTSKSKLEKYKKEILDYSNKDLTPKSIKKLLADRIEISEMQIYRFLKKIKNEE